ncbi:hypothetical protein EBZ80_12925 [bacterium]|nr:hypothetical protein [bacterium]
MPVEKYQTFDGGQKLKSFLQTSTGAGDAGKPVALNNSGEIDASMLPNREVDSTTLPASENLAAGDLVNIWSDSGTLKVRKADATSSAKRADGYVLAGVTSPANAVVFHDGAITGLTSLTVGGRYYLSATAGGLTIEASVPTTTGNLIQFVGQAVSATKLLYQPDTNPPVIA